MAHSTKIDFCSHVRYWVETAAAVPRRQLCATALAKQAKAVLGVENLDAVADRGYFSGEEILACDNAGITVTLAEAAIHMLEAAEQHSTEPCPTEGPGGTFSAKS